MDPIKIINLAHQIAPAYWRKERGLTHPKFASLLAPDLPAISESDYSRLTNHGKCSDKLLLVLGRPAVQRRLEEAVDCEGLFRCRSPDEVKQLFFSRAYGRHAAMSGSETSDCLLAPRQPPGEPWPLSLREERVLKHLQSMCVQQGDHQIVCWADPPPVGASYIAHVLASTYLPLMGVRNVFLVQPYAGLVDDDLLPDTRNDIARDDGAPFEQGLAQLARNLGLSPRPGPQELLRALHESRAVLFVLQADHLAEGTRAGESPLGDLLHEARRSNTGRPSGSPVPIVLVGQPGGERVGACSKWLTDESLAFRLPAAHGLTEYFEQHLQRYLRLRPAGTGPQDSIERLKRARESLGPHPGTPVWPGSVRMLAFFASNKAHMSCFDPTAGWQRLAGMAQADLPTDVQLHLAEVVGQARKVRAGGQRNTPERALRWCSTAVHWFTEDAADHLGSRLEPKTTLEAFQRGVDQLHGLVQTASVGEGGAPVYRADLALRAVVQDRWAQRDSLDRAAAHHQIAQRLQALSDSKEMLPVEYPMRPHWGRSRMYFLAESLRHLVRSCEHAPRTARPAAGLQDARPAFPLSPRGADGKWRPGYAQEVLDHCFDKIFWQQLNANQPTGQVHNRKLARQHGAYYLTAELLQLMSDDGRLGHPHWALDPALTGRYLREVAYAQLDLGDLEGARAMFEKLIDHGRAQGAEPSDGIDFHLDLVVVLSALNELDAARHALAQARRDFERLPSEGNTAVVRRNRLTARTRLDAREAQLQYLSGNLDDALAILERIQATNPRAMARDVAHTYIATLGALGGAQRLHKAMTLCMQNLFDNTSGGLHHGALGFRVSLGHLFRKLDMLDVAEVTLDQVCRDVQLYGCSERTYLAILLEAGRVVLAQGRPARAYAAYLRPCLDRARSCGHQRKAVAALRYARLCIERLLADQASGLPLDRDRLAVELKGRGEPPDPDRGQADGDAYAAGTHFPLDSWIDRLQGRPQLLAELEQLA